MKTEIEQFNPCNEALQFRQQFATFKEAWDKCPRGDWMLWIAKKLGVDIRTLILAKGYCANTVFKLMKDKRSRDAVKAAIKFGKGLIEQVELDAAADAACAAAYAAAYTAGAAGAASAAAYAAYAAYVADAYAAGASGAAAYAAYATYAARKSNQLKTAKICRKYLTEVVMKKINAFNQKQKEGK